MNCQDCGRFLPKEGYISYAYYSGASELEPREPTNICKSCYDKADKDLLNRTTWIKPFVVRMNRMVL